MYLEKSSRKILALQRAEAARGESGDLTETEVKIVYAKLEDQEELAIKMLAGGEPVDKIKRYTTLIEDEIRSIYAEDGALVDCLRMTANDDELRRQIKKSIEEMDQFKKDLAIKMLTDGEQTDKIKRYTTLSENEIISIDWNIRKTVAASGPEQILMMYEKIAEMSRKYDEDMKNYNLNIAIQMVRCDEPVDKIIHYTSLSKEEIEKIRIKLTDQ